MASLYLKTKEEEVQEENVVTELKDNDIFVAMEDGIIPKNTVSDKGNSYHALFQSQSDIRKCEGVNLLLFTERKRFKEY